ncbi:MAG: TonB C-terminal domain-containing protein, partial [Deltaproteobacteria bacterium]|nr:TonB C-terminal domain-containing protein [Deltaproteobacteria bacterium]
SKRDLMAIISIKISRAGNLMEKWIEKPSGSAAFDNSAIRAIEKAAPFPPLPDVFKSNFMELGIRFCPYGCPKEMI